MKGIWRKKKISVFATILFAALLTVGITSGPVQAANPNYRVANSEIGTRDVSTFAELKDAIAGGYDVHVLNNIVFLEEIRIPSTYTGKIFAEKDSFTTIFSPDTHGENMFLIDGATVKFEDIRLDKY